MARGRSRVRVIGHRVVPPLLFKSFVLILPGRYANTFDLQNGSGKWFRERESVAAADCPSAWTHEETGAA
ncbi:hypothetical protein GCM10020221_11870 [Streptomyces thioluteus]|uniref:Uncharacterized protein n=1 Tax=Streptomyces thioluteus TaxID=66431 RepID=A0ABP6J1I8_STRTU